MSSCKLSQAPAQPLRRAPASHVAQQAVLSPNHALRRCTGCWTRCCETWTPCWRSGAGRWMRGRMAAGHAQPPTSWQASSRRLCACLPPAQVHPNFPEQPRPAFAHAGAMAGGGMLQAARHSSARLHNPGCTHADSGTLLPAAACALLCRLGCSAQVCSSVRYPACQVPVEQLQPAAQWLVTCLSNLPHQQCC